MHCVSAVMMLVAFLTSLSASQSFAVRRRAAPHQGAVLLRGEDRSHRVAHASQVSGEHLAERDQT